ncbi:polysaccharide deacetylase family protein [Marinobacter apostichopi]|uniref:polysaccharide deacetylase family protein n=1 Tax=Marinobacter apostichopi TaxID=3035454 RepID=UPI00257228E3|nr:polysaccharide deacetylase family protein [Marinobacter sp. LA51]
MAHLRSGLKYFVLGALAVYGWIRMRLTSKSTLIILTYHRILPDHHSDRHVEQPGMVTSPEVLRSHIRLMQSVGAVPVHLDDWLSMRVKNEYLPKLSFALTFDDGWQDNYRYAFPVLSSEATPATIFLVTGLLDTHRVFWPEQILKLLTSAALDKSSPEFQWLCPFLPSESSSDSPLTLEQADEVISRLKALDDKTILDHLAGVPKAAVAATPEESFRPILNSTELSEMAASNLVRFGAHTQNHFRLNRIDSAPTLRDEIVGCQEDLKRLGRSAVPIFCYPNGDITADGQKLVKENYQAACTTKIGWNPQSRDAFDLRRFNLHDGNSSSPRKLFATIGRGIL